ncbi:ATP-binding cassette domain-containing protein [Archangium sp.]|uniref:ABC transporter ATP-binding protein n=1 Tax=Archangium sp. TaxID=1872627 RepID=UPI00389A0FB1
METPVEGVLAARYEELKALIQSSDLARGTKRLLDLAKDFRPRRELLNETILLSAEYGRLVEDERRFGPTDSTEHARNRLLFRMLQLADVLYDEALQRARTDVAVLEEGDSVTGCPVMTARSGTTLEEARLQFFLQRRLAEGHLQPGAQPQFPVLRCLDLRKSYQSRSHTFTLSEVSLTVYPGEITGVVGSNGSGKSTLLRLLAGEMLADAGELHYPSFQQAPSDWHELRDRIAYVPQQTNMWHGTVARQLALHASLRGINGRDNQDEVEFILHRLGLERYREASRDQLSGGFQTRFELARALVWNPRLLILDEPLAPLDVNSQQVFLQDLKDLARSMRNPLPIIVSSQHLFEIESIADQLLVLENGKPRFYGPAAELGRARAMNSFEFACAASLERVQATLSGIGGIQLEMSGRNIILHVPLAITGADVLKTLLADSQLEIQYFRDISHSSRRMLAARQSI